MKANIVLEKVEKIMSPSFFNIVKNKWVPGNHELSISVVDKNYCDALLIRLGSR